MHVDSSHPEAIQPGDNKTVEQPPEKIEGHGFGHDFTVETGGDSELEALLKDLNSPTENQPKHINVTQSNLSIIQHEMSVENLDYRPPLERAALKVLDAFQDLFEVAPETQQHEMVVENVEHHQPLEAAAKDVADALKDLFTVTERKPLLNANISVMQHEVLVENVEDHRPMDAAAKDVADAFHGVLDLLKVGSKVEKHTEKLQNIKNDQNLDATDKLEKLRGTRKIIGKEIKKTKDPEAKKELETMKEIFNKEIRVQKKIEKKEIQERIDNFNHLDVLLKNDDPNKVLVLDKKSLFVLVDSKEATLAQRKEAIAKALSKMEGVFEIRNDEFGENFKGLDVQKMAMQLMKNNSDIREHIESNFVEFKVNTSKTLLSEIKESNATPQEKLESLRSGMNDLIAGMQELGGVAESQIEKLREIEKPFIKLKEATHLEVINAIKNSNIPPEKKIEQLTAERDNLSKDNVEGFLKKNIKRLEQTKKLHTAEINFIKQETELNRKIGSLEERFIGLTVAHQNGLSGSTAFQEKAREALQDAKNALNDLNSLKNLKVNPEKVKAMEKELTAMVRILTKISGGEIEPLILSKEQERAMVLLSKLQEQSKQMVKVDSNDQDVVRERDELTALLGNMSREELLQIIDKKAEEDFTSSDQRTHGRAFANLISKQLLLKGVEIKGGGTTLLKESSLGILDQEQLQVYNASYRAISEKAIRTKEHYENAKKFTLLINKSFLEVLHLSSNNLEELIAEAENNAKNASEDKQAGLFNELKSIVGTKFIGIVTHVVTTHAPISHDESGEAKQYSKNIPTAIKDQLKKDIQEKLDQYKALAYADSDKGHGFDQILKDLQSPATTEVLSDSLKEYVRAQAKLNRVSPDDTGLNYTRPK